MKPTYDELELQCAAMREALERFTEPGNFIQVENDIPTNWRSGVVYISPLVEDPFINATQILTTHSAGKEILSEVVELRKTLEFYADHNEWIDYKDYGRAPGDKEWHRVDSHFDGDEGKRARQALNLPHTQSMSRYVEALEKVAEAARKYRDDYGSDEDRLKRVGLFQALVVLDEFEKKVSL